MSWFYYALATPALYSVTNFIDKFIVDKKVEHPLVITVVSGLIVGMLGILMGVLGAFKEIPLYQLLLILTAGIFLEWYLWPYYIALKRDDTSRVVPLFQSVPLFVLAASSIFLKESLTVRQGMGFVLILCGGFFLAIEKLEGWMIRLRPSFWYMMLSSLLYAMALVLFRFVTKTHGFWTTVSYEFVGMAIGALFLLVVPSIRTVFIQQLAAAKSIAGLIVVNDVVALAARMSEGYALTLVAAPLVSIVGGTQPLFVFLYGLFLSLVFPHLIKEDVRRHVIGLKVMSITLIFSGLWFINR